MAAPTEKPVKVGQRVSVKDKGAEGVVSFVGMTEFAPGKWIGVSLDEPKGKNNGTVQGRTYFACPEKHGVFVRQTNVVVLDDSGPGLSPNDPTTPRPGSGSATPTSALPRPSSSSGTRSSGLPKAKSRLPGPTQGRSPSFTNLKPKGGRGDQTPSSGAGGMQRERSFVEPNFVETLKPPSVQVEAGLGQGAAQKLSATLEEKVAHLQTQQELNAVKEETEDLKEKLETLKIKRSKDLEKLKEFEKMRIQYDQLIEFKARIMESQSTLQKELQKAKHEAREAIEAREQHAEEMAELTETVEMATLDKEMAEEKADTLQMELDSAKEKIEELQLDLDIVKTEMESGDVKEGGSLTNFEVKQLTAQNEKLRETLVKMRDLSAHEKAEILKLTKELEEDKADLAKVRNENSKLKVENEKLEVTIGDLQEQVDASLGAEEMVENLTTKCLDFEDKISALIEEKQDLEALHEMDEELQENLRDTEVELREEIDMANGKIREMARTRDAAYEIISDHETTIKKFRDLMATMREQNMELRAALESETKKPVEQEIHEMIDFKKMFAESKAQSKLIDAEIRKCEVEQANRHIKLLNNFMSSSFFIRGGDADAVLVLLLVPRMIWKLSILTNQIKDKFVDQFGLQMMHHLQHLVSMLHRYDHVLNSCDPATFLKMGTFLQEMSGQEKLSVDFYIELLRKDELDENVPMDHIEKSISFFQQLYLAQLDINLEDHTNKILNDLKVVWSGLECVEQEIIGAKKIIPSDDSEISVFFKTTENDVGSIKQVVKQMRRRLPLQEQLADGKFKPKEFSVKFSKSEISRMDDVLKDILMIVKVFHGFRRSSGLSIDGLSSGKAGEIFKMAIDKAFLEGGLETLKSMIGRITKVLSDQNNSLQDGDWDVDPGKEREMRMAVLRPVELRAEAYKAEIKEAESMKFKLEGKDHDIKDLRRILKEKTEELSEMQVRKDKAEKRLTDANREAELMMEKLQRKLDDSQTMLKRKEKEFEETMDQLQTDIDSLESERGELKNKLKETTKKVLLEGITRSPSTGPTSIGPSVPAPIKDSPMLLQQNHDLQLALQSLKAESLRLNGGEMLKRLNGMAPISVPKKAAILPSTPEKKDASKEDRPTLDQLMLRARDLKSRVDKALVSAKVVNLGTGDGRRDVVTRSLQQKLLREESDQLKLEVAKFLSSKKPGGQVNADFCSFPSSQFTKSIKETDYSIVGRVRMNGQSKDVKIKKVPVIVGHRDLHRIHMEVF